MVAFAAFAAAVGARLAYFAAGPLPDAMAAPVARLLRFELRSLQFSAWIAPYEIAALALLAGALVWRPRWIVSAATGSRVRAHAWIWALAGTLCVLHHYLFDADPWTAKICWAALAAFWIWLALAAWRIPIAPAGLVWLVLPGLVLAAVAAPSPSCAAAAVVWACVLVACGSAARDHVHAVDAGLLALVALPLCTFVIPIGLAGWLPDPVRRSATVLDERGYAYNFCERPDGGQLFLTVPLCSADRPEDCRDGYVAEYDAQTLSRRGEHRFFDDTFYGALRELVCLGDVVQVTMNHVRLGGRTYTANVMDFDADDPSQFRRTIFPEPALGSQGVELPGHRAAYDRTRNAVFYVSEWTNTVYRLDRATGAFDFDVGAAFPYKRRKRSGTYGLFTGPESVDEATGSLYLTEWGDGSRVWELDLETLKLRSMRDTHDTGSFGATVDAERRRLITSGFWGINVFDLETGELLLRQRLGPGVREAQIDTHNDLIYVATTFGGHLWVIDRDTLRTLARVSTGLGGRRPYVSHDGRRLFASSQSQIFAIDTDAIVRRIAPHR